MFHVICLLINLDNDFDVHAYCLGANWLNSMKCSEIVGGSIFYLQNPLVCVVIFYN